MKLKFYIILSAVCISLSLLPSMSANAERSPLLLAEPVLPNINPKRGKCITQCDNDYNKCLQDVQDAHSACLGINTPIWFLGHNNIIPFQQCWDITNGIGNGIGVIADAAIKICSKDVQDCYAVCNLMFP